jgi:hypothetical protein
VSYQPKTGDQVVARYVYPVYYSRTHAFEVRGRVVGVCNRSMGIYQVAWKPPTGQRPEMGVIQDPLYGVWVVAKAWTTIRPDTPEEGSQAILLETGGDL